MSDDRQELMKVRAAATLAYGLLWLFQGNSEDDPRCHLAFKARTTLRDALPNSALAEGIYDAKSVVQMNRWNIPLEYPT